LRAEQILSSQKGTLVEFFNPPAHSKTSGEHKFKLNPFFTSQHEVTILPNIQQTRPTVYEESHMEQTR